MLFVILVQAGSSGSGPRQSAFRRFYFARTLGSFPHDANNLFPDWRDKLDVKGA